MRMKDHVGEWRSRIENTQECTIIDKNEIEDSMIEIDTGGKVMMKNNEEDRMRRGEDSIYRDLNQKDGESRKSDLPIILRPKGYPSAQNNYLEHKFLNPKIEVRIESLRPLE